MTETVVRFFQEGGFFMYPIAVILVIGLAIALERWLYLSSAKRSNRAAFDQGILPILRKRDYKAALKLTNDSSTAIAAIMGAGLSRLVGGSRREDVEFAMEEG